MKTYLGLDFGGTKLLIGEIDETGRVLRSKRYDTFYNSQEEAVKGVMSNIDDYLETVGLEGELQAAGMGIVGIVNNTKGLWVSMGHDLDAPGIPLAAMLEEKLGVPSAIDNDVRSATTAEWILGKGRESSDFLYLNVGTGLAVGIVTGGHLVRGSHHNSGEIGHMVVDITDDQPCICGREGCVENVVSGIGFTRQVKRYGLEDLLNDKDRADVARLFERADAGDETCVKITEYAADILACTMMNLVRVTDPDTIILGGGVITSGWLLEKVQKRLDPNTMRGITGGIVFSSFDKTYAGLIGAASLGILKLKQMEN